LADAPLQLLQIEDDAIHARLIQELLRDGGGDFRVHTARRLVEGVQTIASSNVDLVLLDLTLPDSRGSETVEAMQPFAPLVPIVIMSGLADDRIAIEAVQHGFEDYIVKGEISASQLVQRLLYAVGRHGGQRDLRDRALRDELTGLYNRGAFTEFLGQQLKLHSRSARGFTLCYLDVDDFKAINDRFGHQVGDDALRDVAEVLRETFRSSDVLGRLGGDEFGVIAVDGAGDGILAARDRLGQHLEEHTIRRGRPYRLRASVGLAPSGMASQPEQLIAVADANMYEQKRASKHRRGVSGDPSELLPSGRAA
jgi:diguanylate cyclase (GGDEF)-like protein